jgi:hypothetical protein
MTTSTQLTERPAIEYPDSDGLPMAENTLQYEWIVTIKGGLDAMFRDDPNVFVAGEERIPRMAGFVSPRLGVRFEPGEGPDSLRIFLRPTERGS